MNGPHRKGRAYTQLYQDGQIAGPRCAVTWRVSRAPNKPATGPYHGWTFVESVQNVTVRELALFLAQTPFQVLADLLKMGVLANPDTSLPLATAFELLRHHGYIVEQA